MTTKEYDIRLVILMIINIQVTDATLVIVLENAQELFSD
jgi:hypothetical protein